MIVNEDAERMKQLLTEAITVLCKSGFNFTSEFCVEGLLGITFDKKDIVLLNINETFKLAAGKYCGKPVRRVCSSIPTRVISIPTKVIQDHLQTSNPQHSSVLSLGLCHSNLPGRTAGLGLLTPTS